MQIVIRITSERMYEYTHHWDIHVALFLTGFFEIFLRFQGVKTKAL
jgi:hypothetical protein